MNHAITLLRGGINMPWWGILLIILAVLGILMFVLYRYGKKLQDKQVSQKEQMLAAAQPTSMLIIDKKMLPLQDAGLPKVVLEQTPKRYQKAKVPIVKAKIGPKIMNLMCDDAIFDDVPTRGEVKAMVSGIYLVSVKSVHGKKNVQVEEDDGKKKKKKGFSARMRAKQVEYQKQLNDEIRAKQNSSNKKTTVKQTAAPEISEEAKKKNKERAKKISDSIK